MKLILCSCFASLMHNVNYILWTFELWNKGNVAWFLLFVKSIQMRAHFFICSLVKQFRVPFFFTPTSDPSSSSYHLTSKILTISSPSSTPSLEYPACLHWCHLLAYQHPLCSWPLCPWEVPIQMSSRPFLLSITHFILTHNYFTFNSLHYLQVKATAMGNRMACSYANLFMGSLEDDFLNSKDSKPNLWLRFIDVILLWTHGHITFLFFLSASLVTTLLILPGPSPPSLILTCMLTN